MLAYETLPTTGTKKTSVPILVVDDDRSLRMIFEWIVKDIDPALSLDWCSSAGQAEEALQKSDYRLIIADFMLEGPANGLDIWERCQQSGADFVLMSSLRLEDFLRKEGENSTLPRLLAKPLDVNEVQEIIRKSLGKAR